MYRTANDYFQSVFGCKVYKLSLNGGFTCPNRDGTCGSRGCIFCSDAGGGEFAPSSTISISQQLEDAKKLVQKKCKSGKYIAYFQSFTNTYGSPSDLRNLYEQAMEPDYVVGLAIGTRPDCLSNEIISLLGELNRRKPIMVELGLQTIHPAAISYIRRGYPNAVYLEAVRNLKSAGIHVVTHIILGLPGENRDMCVETTKFAVDAGTDGIKFHLLHVLKGTDLCKDYEQGRFNCLSLEEYGSILKACISVLPQYVVVHRITGDGSKKNLVAPLWSGNKKAVLNHLNSVLRDIE